ncbi:MAG: LTA synthase family protein [Verrucomicrobiota bacterium]
MQPVKAACPFQSYRLWFDSTRYHFCLFWWASVLAGWTFLRCYLFYRFHPQGASWSEMLGGFAAGFHRDAVLAIVYTVPWLFLFWVVGEKFWDRLRVRVAIWVCASLACFYLVFMLFVEYFFFEEFKSRFNTVAVDYLLYPHEVFVNIWDSYPVPLVLVACGAITGGWMSMARRVLIRPDPVPMVARARLAKLVTGVGLAAILGLTLSFKSPEISKDRTLREIANNGSLSFIAAFWTRHLDYTAFYATIEKDEAYRRTRKILAEPGTRFLEEGNSIRRAIAGDSSRPRLNVVIILEESLGSEFWGCLGQTNSLTPCMDKLATQEGMLFANLYASGNRTVRGMEGVLSSFPPLPGDSIVKRDRSDNVETVARVLKRDGYETMFIYGGRGLFDGMRSFAVRNGYDRFIEQKDFQSPVFTTIWGVSDEDLFAKGLQEMRELHAAGKPFLATLLTVSNHKPFTYPPGRIPETPGGRDNVVKYTDYALGKFFKDAKKEPFWTNTIFAVVADHGARVYGKQSIPIRSYEIPLVVLGPAVVKAAERHTMLGGSLDVSPTLLGLIGRPYESLFFGRDLLKAGAVEGRAPLNHNRDVGLFYHERLVVLGLMQAVEIYDGDPHSGNMKLIGRSPDSRETEIQRDTTALYQVADELYVSRRYALDAGIEHTRTNR